MGVEPQIDVEHAIKYMALQIEVYSMSLSSCGMKGVPKAEALHAQCYFGTDDALHSQRDTGNKHCFQRQGRVWSSDLAHRGTKSTTTALGTLHAG